MLERDPFSGHVFVFRGKRGDLVKVLWWSGDGMCLLMKLRISAMVINRFGERDQSGRWCCAVNGL
ncbi:IS66 family insertion sequence element accessory protein TnpB [Burkholderia cenocepacia]|uniref:IS66 family insertion sequence element accessory protein TnpB n=1 Tax=Burkholderia cenocepacia TaxID=95486 RepID=UPI00158A229F